LSLLCLRPLAAQDTVKISLLQAETQFRERNLLLLAEKYNIDAAKAALVQAKVFDNPTVTAGVNIYNPVSERWFDPGSGSGQYTLAVEQLIRLGGKRNKEIAIARIDVEMAEYLFYELLRTLRYALGSAFYEAYFACRSLQAFDMQISLLEDLQANYRELNSRGTVAAGELVRIQSLLCGLRADRLDLQEAFNEAQAQLQLLLLDNRTIFIPEAENEDFAFANPADYQVNKLLSDALESRIDLRTAEAELASGQARAALERAKAVPDMTVGADFDKRSGAFDNQFSLNVAVDLPLFNRNRGNIRAAKAAVKQKELLVSQKQTEIENDVLKAYSNALEADRTCRTIDAEFEQKLHDLLQSITANFRKKNISMLEFTDFYEAYRDNVININKLRNRKAQTMEELRFAVGREF
jgi:cobalt-zinc-cadmium efflux system outer membrane protein